MAHLSLTAPKRPGYGTIAIGGGADVPKARADNFDSLLAAWAGARRNDEVVARLLYGPKTRQKGLTFELLDGVVTGMRTIELTVI